MTKFYKREGDIDQIHETLEQDLKSLNEKLRRMYEIVRNDPQYMKRSYKANAHMIQDILDGKSENLRNSKYDGLDNDDDN